MSRPCDERVDECIVRVCVCIEQKKRNTTQTEQTVNCWCLPSSSTIRRDHRAHCESFRYVQSTCVRSVVNNAAAVVVHVLVCVYVCVCVSSFCCSLSNRKLLRWSSERPIPGWRAPPILTSRAYRRRVCPSTAIQSGSSPPMEQMSRPQCWKCTILWLERFRNSSQGWSGESICVSIHADMESFQGSKFWGWGLAIDWNWNRNRSQNWDKERGKGQNSLRRWIIVFSFIFLFLKKDEHETNFKMQWRDERNMHLFR